MLVGDILRRTATRDPKKTGVVFGDQRLSWHEINDRVNRLANGLIALGLRKGDRVAILCPNCNQYFEFYFAMAKSGLVGVPLNTRLRSNELFFFIKDSGAVAFIAHRDFNDVVQAIGVNLDQVKVWIGIGEGHTHPYDYETLILNQPSTEPQVKVDADDLFVLGYTGGTTGRPKGAMLTHQNAVAGIISGSVEWGLQLNDVLLLCRPLYLGPVQRLYSALRGCTTVIMPFDPSAVLQTIEREKVTVFNTGSTMLTRLISEPNINKYNLSSVRLIGTTADKIPVPLWRKAAKIFGPVFSPTYGLTETGGCGTILRLGEFAMDGPLSKRMGSVGKAVLGIDVRVVDENGNDIRQNGKETGEIILQGDSIMKGYWNMPEETASTLRNGWLYTGDIAEVDEDGYIYIVDRKKDVIKSGGLQIWPSEIEEVILTHPAVLHAAVIGVPDAKWHETPKAIIVLKEGAQASAEEIMELCKTKLASYKKVTSVEFVDSLPLTAMGKVSKKELRERYWSSYQR